jgi:long-chain acyl-CoA synthetase
MGWGKKPYEWLTWSQVEKKAQNVAKGIKAMNLAPEVEGDGKTWKFVGIWAKNRWEWLVTHIANMYFTNTTIGFFDSMGVETVDYILEQTKLSTIFTTSDYIAKIIGLKKDGKAQHIKNIVDFDKVDASQKTECEAVGIQLYSFDEVHDNVAVEAEPFQKCTENDCPIFSYTSGTTGDSKGVKLSHKNLIYACGAAVDLFKLSRLDSMISYLPYPHSFE